MREVDYGFPIWFPAFANFDAGAIAGKWAGGLTP
jgi:hypothetical protein